MAKPLSPTAAYSKAFTATSNAKDALSKALLKKMDIRNQGDGVAFLATLPENSIATAFFDPQYRGVMDKLDYGNEGARQKGRAALEQMPDDVIKAFFAGLNRSLRPSGHLFLWIDKFHLVEGVHPWLKDTALEPVDLITWDKGRMGMGYRTRRQSEYLMVLQKAPKKAKGHWTLHNIPDVWKEKVGKEHPHCKPIELQRRLIAATTPPEDVVIDPAAGSFSVMQAALAEGRHFLGTDLLG